MDGWKPIESAPRDGTAVLLFTTCHGVVEGWFSPGDKTWCHDAGVYEYDGPVWVCADDAFQIEVEDCGEDGLNHGSATAWQPLPDPPNPPSA